MSLEGSLSKEAVVLPQPWPQAQPGRAASGAQASGRGLGCGHNEWAVGGLVWAAPWEV